MLMATLAMGFASYFVALMTLFFWVRAYTWTEEEALPAKDKKPGFGPQISLVSAAKGMFTHRGPRVIALACIVTLVVRGLVFEYSWADLWVIVGVIAFWPFQEWLIHAWLEHMPALRFGKRSLELVITKAHRSKRKLLVWTNDADGGPIARNATAPRKSIAFQNSTELGCRGFSRGYAGVKISNFLLNQLCYQFRIISFFQVLELISGNA